MVFIQAREVIMMKLKISKDSSMHRQVAPQNNLKIGVILIDPFHKSPFYGYYRLIFIKIMYPT
jgi:hypothetical protein